VSKRKVKSKLTINPLPLVTFRTLSVDFQARTITIDGATHHITTACVDMPILSGDAVFLPRNHERIA